MTDANTRIVDWDELYPGRFIKAGLIGDGNARKTVTIGAIHTEELVTEQGARVKGVLTFSDEKMQLPLNKTNGICLREMFGRKVQEWIGKRITLFSDTWNGEPCVRIWGSPELERDMNVVVALPRRKPFTKTMHAVKTGAPQKAAKRAEPPPAEPDPDDDGREPVPSERFLNLLDDVKAATDLANLSKAGADIAAAKKIGAINEHQLKDLRLAYARRQNALDAETAPIT